MTELKVGDKVPYFAGVNQIGKKVKTKIHTNQITKSLTI